MRSIVTGAAGFIGSHLINSLTEKGYETIGIDIFGKPFTESSTSFGSFRNIKSLNCNVLPLDISSDDFIRLLVDFQPDYIFHLAADSNTLSKNEFEIIRNNTLSYRNILAYSDKSNCKIVYASSASIYGTKSKEKYFSETDSKPAPENPYAFSKYQMEIMSKNSNAIGLRLFNVFGPNEIYKKTTSSVSSQIYSSYLQNKEFLLFEDSKETFRDFIYIDDVIKAFIEAAKKGEGIYNVCTGIPRSFQDIYDSIAKVVNLPPPKYKKNPINFGYQKYTCGSTKRIKSLIPNFNPNTLEEGIKKMIDNF